jgi:hypothetical protein
MQSFGNMQLNRKEHATTKSISWQSIHHPSEYGKEE